jgi:CysZ protein
MGGLSYVIRGMKLLTHPALRPFVAIPLLINLVLFGAGIWYGYQQFMDLIGWLSGWISGDLPGWLQWLEWILLPLKWILVPLFVLGAAIVIFFSFTLLANLISAPFNGLLAEKVEYLATGQTIPEDTNDWAKILADIGPAVWTEINKLLYVLWWSLILMILTALPLINLAAPLLWGLFAAWMLAIEYVDIPMGNHNLSGKQVRNRLRTRRFLSLTFGGTVMIMTTIPVLNFLSMPTAVVGATLLWVEKLAKTESA